MGDLSTLNENLPTGNDTPTAGDDTIRETRNKTKGSFSLEHALGGKHAFPIVSILPSFGTAGRLLIKTTIGSADELWYDSGAAWIKVTSNQTVINYIASLAAHIVANPIDHPDASITASKLLAGLLKIKHFIIGSVDNGSVSKLVDTTDASSLHNHDSKYQQLVGSGSVSEADIDWANAGGISQDIVYMNDTVVGVYLAIGWQPFPLSDIYIYIPANANFLEYICEGSTDRNTLSGIKFYNTTVGEGTITSNLDSVTGDRLWTTNVGVIDISALNGWSKFTMYGWHDTNLVVNITLHNIAYRIK